MLGGKSFALNDCLMTAVNVSHTEFPPLRRQKPLWWCTDRKLHKIVYLSKYLRA